ncbi:endolytic transglycosylase MltG [Nocardioides aurantiacus]|uniref:endolytic transglycosylase MltG n=1 Tax=Nocardioides aurantiacus TaxID=86796 RepID=UPI00403F7B57
MSHTDYSGDEPLLEDGYDDEADDWSYEEPRKRRLSSCLPVLAVLAVLGAGLFLGGRWAYDELSTRLASAPDFEGPGTGEVVYQVEDGSTSAQIGRDLKEAGVVASVDAFTEAARLEEDSRNIQVGYYQLQEKMKASDALDVLVDPANLVQALVTVPEGARVRQVVDSIAKNTDIRRRAVVRALADGDAIGLPAEAEGNPEGYLFPATYTVPPKMTAVELISQMVAKTKEVEASLDIETRAAALGLTPEEVLTVASILEYEANKSEDYPRVARVLYNRLDDDMALQLDSTVSYVSGRSGDVWTTSAERDSDSQYNTYRYAGLPPGPIGSPGEETIEAALKPAKGDWLFFVPDYEADTTRFSVTLAEHNRWVEKLREYCRTNEDC